MLNLDRPFKCSHTKCSGTDTQSSSWVRGTPVDKQCDWDAPWSPWEIRVSAGWKPSLSLSLDLLSDCVKSTQGPYNWVAETQRIGYWWQILLAKLVAKLSGVGVVESGGGGGFRGVLTFEHLQWTKCNLSCFHCERKFFGSAKEYYHISICI